MSRTACRLTADPPAQMVLPLPVGAHTKQFSSLLYKEVNTCRQQTAWRSQSAHNMPPLLPTKLKPYTRCKACSCRYNSPTAGWSAQPPHGSTTQQDPSTAVFWRVLAKDQNSVHPVPRTCVWMGLKVPYLVYRASKALLRSALTGSGCRSSSSVGGGNFSGRMSCLQGFRQQSTNSEDHCAWTQQGALPETGRRVHRVVLHGLRPCL